jgi:hypothetical protein
LETFRVNGAFRHIKDRIGRAVPSLQPKNDYYSFLNNIQLRLIPKTAIAELIIHLFPYFRILRHHCYIENGCNVIIEFYCKDRLDTKYVIDTDLIIINQTTFIGKSSFTKIRKDTRLKDALYKLLFG